MSYRFYKELYDLNNVKEAYELDENLVMTQMRWLNKTEREMREIISCGKVDETERALVRVKEVFDRIVGVKIKKEEYKKTVLDINKSFYDNLDFLLRQLTLSGDEKKYLDLVQKKRELSKPFVDFLCAHYSKLNYRQLVRDGKYCLMQIESGEE